MDNCPAAGQLWALANNVPPYIHSAYMNHLRTVLLGSLLACGCGGGSGGGDTGSDAGSDAGNITSCAMACEHLADCVDYNTSSCEAACSQLTISASSDLYECLDVAACADTVAVEACIPFDESPS